MFAAGLPIFPLDLADFNPVQL